MENSIASEKVCSTITSNVGESQETQATVTFHDEACKEVTLGYAQDPQYNADPELYQLAKYLERPMKRETFILNTTKSWIVNNTDPMMLQASLRLRGALGFRFSLKFRLQVVASPFSSGIYRLLWLPAQSSLRLGDLVNVPQIASQAFGVNINLQDQTEVVLDIPYTHFVDFMPVNVATSWPATSQYGTLFLVPLVAADPGGSSANVTATLWVSMHDIQIQGMTPYNTVTAVVQGLATLAVNALSAAAGEQQCEGAAAPCEPIEHAGDKTKLGKVVGDTLWFAKKAAGVASAFGFGRPINQNPFGFMRRSSFFQTGIDVATTSLPLGTNQDSTVAPIKTNSDIDEMSLLNFAQRPGLFGQFDYKTTDPIDALKFYFHATPFSMNFDRTGNNSNNCKHPYQKPVVQPNTVVVPTPLMYVSNCFGMWRGDIKLRFMASKTKFHAGRLRITYLPTGQQISDTTANNVIADPDKPMDGLSIVWDLRESSEIEMVLPYMHSQYYTQNWMTTASLSVVVMEPLVAPDTVKNTVRVLVWGMAGNKFEWAVPVTPVYPPFRLSDQTLPPAIPQPFPPAVLIEPADENIAVTQSGDTQDDRGSEMTVGESVVSVKQLITKPRWWVTGSTALASARTHWWATTLWPSSNSPGIPSINIDADMMSYWASVFAFARGGTKFSVTPLSDKTRFAFRTLYNSKAGPIRANMINDGTGAMIVNDLNTGMEVTLPFYQTVSKVPTCVSQAYYRNSETSVNGGSYAPVTIDSNSLGWNVYNRAYAQFISLDNLTGGSITTFAPGAALMSITAADDAQLFNQLPCPFLFMGFRVSNLWQQDFGQIQTENVSNFVARQPLVQPPP